MNTAVISGISLLLFAIPAYHGLLHACGWKRALVIIMLLNAVGLAVETIALTTGFPYGHFRYSNNLGFKLFDLTPWSVGLSWSMLLIGSVTIAQRVHKNPLPQLAIVVLLLLSADLVLDPGAVSLGYWHYTHAPNFYQVPYTNFLGWVLSGTLGAVILLKMIHWRSLPVFAAGSFLCILVFWTGIDWYLGLVIPGIIGILLTSVTVWVMVSRKASVSAKASGNN